MDHDRFDTWTMDLTRADRSRSRRWALAHIAGAALGGLVAAAGVDRPAAAAACKKVDEPCRRPGQCCSGVCGGRRGNKKCRGHGAGTCKRNDDLCTTPNPDVLRCNNGNCTCVQTTGGTSFCAEGGAGGVKCASCNKDDDCVTKFGFPPGSACFVTSKGRCSGACPSGRACVTRCGVTLPPPEAGRASPLLT